MELLSAERLNRENPEALGVIRDCYETLGILNRALMLTTKLVNAEEDEEELYRLYPGYYWEDVVAAAREAEAEGVQGGLCFLENHLGRFYFFRVSRE